VSLSHDFINQFTKPKRWELAGAGSIVLAATGCLVLTQVLGKPALAVVLPVGLALIPMLLRQRLILGVLGVVEVANLGTIAQDHGVPNLYVALVTVALVGILLRWARDGQQPVWSSVLWFAAAFFVTRLGSILSATDPGASAISLIDLCKDLAFFAVVLTLCVHAGGERLLTRSIVITGAVLCLLQLIQQFLLNNSATFFGLSQLANGVDVGLAVERHTGPLTDQNFWGRVLIVIVPLALSLFADRSAGCRRWWWFAAFLLLLGGVYLTGSRGTLLVTAVVIAVWLSLAGPAYRRLLLFAPLLAGVLMLVPGVGSRLASVNDVSTTADSQADLSLIGRVQVHKLGVHMFLEHPAIGVGAGNFVVVEPAYQRHYGIDLPEAVLAPHDLYLEMAAESGVLGLAGWLGLYGSGLFVAVRARLLTRRETPTDEPTAEWLLTGGVIAGLLGWGLASILLHLATFRTFLLILVIAATLDMRARRTAATRQGHMRWWPGMLLTHVVPSRASGLGARRAVAVIAFAVTAGVGMLVPGVLIRQWSASTELRIAVQPSDSPPNAYSVAVMSRESLALTYLSLLGNEYFRRQAEDSLQLTPALRAATTVTAATSSPPGVLLVTAVGPEPNVARDIAKEVSARVIAYIDGLRPLYELREVPAGDAEPTPMTVTQPAALGVVIITASSAGAAAWMLVGIRQRSIRHQESKSPATTN
jgi:O-antigen ligase